MWNFIQPIEELHNIFNYLNKEIFASYLPLPSITIQSRGKRNALGWCSNVPIWLDNDNKDTRHEINICAENSNMLVVDIVEIMLHEMVHYYADLQGIKTTSRNGTFHNKNYKQYAEKFGLIVTKTEKYGYAETKLNDATLNKVKDLNFKQEVFLLYRINDEGKVSKKKGSIKHTCPDCGNVARSTKEMKLICGNCETEMDNNADEMDDN